MALCSHIYLLICYLKGARNVLFLTFFMIVWLYEAWVERRRNEMDWACWHFLHPFFIPKGRRRRKLLFRLHLTLMDSASQRTRKVTFTTTESVFIFIFRYQNVSYLLLRLVFINIDNKGTMPRDLFTSNLKGQCHEKSFQTETVGVQARSYWYAASTFNICILSL